MQAQAGSTYMISQLAASCVRICQGMSASEKLLHCPDSATKTELHELS